MIIFELSKANYPYQCDKQGTDEVSSDSEKQQGEVVVDVSHETRSAPNVSDRVGAVATTTPASADANNGTPNALPTKASEESSTVPVSEPIVPTPADQTSPDSEEVNQSPSYVHRPFLTMSCTRVLGFDQGRGAQGR